MTNEEWDRAAENVKDLIPLYMDLGVVGLWGLTHLLGLWRRYCEGERSEDLFESMVTAE